MIPTQEDTMSIIGQDGKPRHLFRTRAEEDAAVARSPLKVALGLLAMHKQYALIRELWVARGVRCMRAQISAMERRRDDAAELFGGLAWVACERSGLSDKELVSRYASTYRAERTVAMAMRLYPTARHAFADPREAWQSVYSQAREKARRTRERIARANNTNQEQQ